MRNTVGSPVEGDDFYGREVEMRQLWQRLETDHILMLAPRRMGKTSILKRLRDTSAQHHRTVVMCSFEGCEDEFGCIAKIINALNKHGEFKKKISNIINKFLSNVKGLKPQDSSKRWHPAMDSP